MKSLRAQGHTLATADRQVELLEHEGHFQPFQQKLDELGLYPLMPEALQILQINLGKMCNQVCKHCHVDAGPDRKEIMNRETMEQGLEALRKNPAIGTVDLTGGAPEMNPDFRWFVAEIKKLCKHIIVRCNLTILVANRKYHDLPQFYKDHGVELASSLPFYNADRTDRQRGNGVFEDSIRALRMLNDVGYGQEGSGLRLNLVYNPAGAFLPPAQESLQREYKEVLREQFGIEFNELFVITNMPISRYLEYLIRSGNYEQYMEKLVTAFNAAAAHRVMCRNTLSVGWDGYLYDCDFNQMLDLKVAHSGPHISAFDGEGLQAREIVVGQHCYGCTAGAGSSCGGVTT